MASAPLFQRPRPKVYLGYDHHGDGEYYALSQRLFASVCDFTHDRSLERELGAEDAEAYRRHLRETMEGTGCAIILCGARTHLDPFVDWEIQAALERKAGLMAIVLPGNPARPDGTPTLPDRLRDNWDSGYAVVCGWRDLADGKIDLTHRIAFASARMAEQIVDTRPLLPPR